MSFREEEEEKARREEARKARISRDTRRDEVNYWKNTENNKKLLLDFAAVQGFDPNVKENWYNVTTTAIASSGVINWSLIFSLIFRKRILINYIARIRGFVHPIQGQLPYHANWLVSRKSIWCFQICCQKYVSFFLIFFSNRIRFR